MSARQLSARRLGLPAVPDTIFDGDEEFPYSRMLGPGEVPSSQYRQKLLTAVSQVHATLRAIRVGNRMTRGMRWDCGVYGWRLSCKCGGIPDWCPCSHEHLVEAQMLDRPPVASEILPQFRDQLLSTPYDPLSRSAIDEIDDLEAGFIEAPQCCLKYCGRIMSCLERHPD